MADFSTPFASTASRRSPNADEKANGFPCGPADQTLFNGLFHRIESELGAVISYAGLSQSDTNLSQLRDAILAIVSAATGGGETSDYLLLSQAQARLPIYPEVLSTDGRINITSPAAGTVRVPGNVNFLHRGIGLVTSEETDFATVASRTYHLRWNPTNGFQLKWLGDNAYNPGGLDEKNVAFDSSYDDMLVARVITNSGNVATITTLANKHRLIVQGQNLGNLQGAGPTHEDNVTYSNIQGLGAAAENVAINFARTPFTALNGVFDLTTQQSSSADIEINVVAKTESRYNVRLIASRSLVIGDGVSLSFIAQC